MEKIQDYMCYQRHKAFTTILLQGWKKRMKNLTNLAGDPRHYEN